MIEVINPHVFTSNQKVQVFHQDGRNAPRRPLYIGTIVHYARNGAFTVREPVHGTTCNHYVRDLELIPANVDNVK